MDSNAVVLCSGGMDSVTVLGLASQKHSKLYVFFVNYNQKTLNREREYSKLAAERFNAEWIEFELKNLSKITKTSLITDSSNNNTETEVQGRNTILIGLASAYAQTIGAHYLYIGIQSQDVIYGDAQPEFFKHISKAMKIAYDINLKAPLLFNSKSEIIKIAQEINVDLSKTYSCYYNENEPCGICPSCKVRALAEKSKK